MSAHAPAICPSCGRSYLVQQHTVSVHNVGALSCPNCRETLVKWSGNLFYTLAVDLPRSSGDMAIIDEQTPADL
jgi:hypothetical protein